MSGAPTTRHSPVARRRRRVRITLAALGALAVLAATIGGVAFWRSRPGAYRPGEDHAEITRTLAHDLPDEAPELRLTDVTAEAGLGDSQIFAGPRSSQLPEDMGGGAAWGDFDDDGDDDLFLVAAGASLQAPEADRAACGLFENRGDGTFRRAAGFPELKITGMAAAWGDATGDGRLDLVVSGYRCLRLFRNEGNGRFVRDADFPEPPGYWAGVSWADIDHDRDLDLYVCGYVQYVEDEADRARASRQFGKAIPYTLNPSSYPPQRNLLLLNDGTGAFRDVAGERGVANEQGRSLAALWHDLDGDGRTDLYVANDVSDNACFRNLGDGRFEEISHAVWLADYRGAMGLAVGDYDRDGDDDIFVTHWTAQENALYDSLLVDHRDLEPQEPQQAQAQAPDLPYAFRYMDVAAMRGVGQIALQTIGWGCEFVDLDADGWLDLLVANGSTFEDDAQPPRLRPQEPFVLWNRRGESFHDLAPMSPVLSQPRVSRGLAVADFDLDGDQDVLIVHLDGGVQLLRNDMPGGHWLQLRLRSRGPTGELTASGEGAVLVAHAGGQVLRRAVTGPSYLSQSSRTIHFGLGDVRAVEKLEVRWAGGEAAIYENLRADALWELHEGDPAPRLIREGAAEALDERERVVRFWAAHRAAMNALKARDDCTTAIPLFREALALDPAHEDARYYLANCLAAEGQMSAAIDELEELLRVAPRSHRGLKRLGVLRANTARTRRDLDEASALLERALEVNREETGALLVMGEIDIIAGDLDRAGQHLEWACRTNPRAVSGFFLRGYVAWARGDAAGARELLQQARAARGEEFKPEGTTAEGDVARRMHAEQSPLAPFWSDWDGAVDPARAFATLDAYLRSHPVGAPGADASSVSSGAERLNDRFDAPTLHGVAEWSGKPPSGLRCRDPVHYHQEDVMNAKDLLRHNLRFTHQITKKYLEDFSEEEMLVRAVPGSNHAAWQLGHLIASERSLLQAAGAEVPDLPEGFAEAHGKDNVGSDDPGHFLSKGEYFQLMETMHQAAEKAIDKVDEAGLDAPAPEKMRSFFPTVGSILLMTGSHEMMHSGQLAAVRRKLGKPVVI